MPYAGHDGKTGETLLKSVLAPMFAMRNLRVRSWSGLNLLGGGDGANLADAGRQRGQDRQQTAGARPRRSATSRKDQTRIDYVPDIGDFKTAWDLVTFEGFLGAPMRLEFTWHGCDSALAAPLVLDLGRLTAAAHAAGLAGPLAPLAFFFKDPLGTVSHALAEQWRPCASSRSAATGADGSARGERCRHFVTSPNWYARRPRCPCPVTSWPVPRRPGRWVRVPPGSPPPRSASTGPAWPPTTGPTGTSTPPNGRSDRSRPAGSAPTALGTAIGLTAAGLGSPPRPAVVGPWRSRRRWPPPSGRTTCKLKNTPAGPAAMAVCRGLDVLLGASRGRLRRAVRPALVVAAHTYALTALSRDEVHGGTAAAAGRPPWPVRRRSPPWPRSPLRRRMHGRGASVPPRRRRPGTPPTFGRAQRRVLDKPSPDRVRAAVGAGITALPALQAALCAAAGAPATAAAGRRGGPARPAAGPEGVADMRFGYGTNGFANHRLTDALDVIADLGYQGVALTLDHDHLDPYAPDLAGRTRTVAAAAG